MIPSHQSHIARFGQSTQYIYIKRDERSAWTQDVRVSAPLHGLNITSALRASTCDSANKTGTRFELPEAFDGRRTPSTNACTRVNDGSSTILLLEFLL